MEAQIEQITPALAAKMLLTNDHNRPLSRVTVRLYSEAMQRGEWDAHSQIVIAEDGTLLDGQHRLAAVVDSGVTISCVVLRGAPRGAQETIDTGKKRSFANVLTLRGESNASSVAAACRIIFRIVEGDMRNNKAITNKQLLAVLERHPGVRDHASFAGMKAIKRLGVPAGMLVPLRYLFSLVDDEDAVAFFDLLASGAGLEEGSPILALRRRLESTDGWMKDRPAVTAAWFIKAWNAWRAGREMQVLRWKVGGANPEPFPAIEGLTQALRGMEKSA